jgi:hypothetical protein
VLHPAQKAPASTGSPNPSAVARTRCQGYTSYPWMFAARPLTQAVWASTPYLRVRFASTAVGDVALSTGPTATLRASVRRHRRAQGDRSTLRSITLKRAATFLAASVDPTEARNAGGRLAKKSGQPARFTSRTLIRTGGFFHGDLGYGCEPTDHRGAFSDRSSWSFCRLGPTAHRFDRWRRQMLSAANGPSFAHAPAVAASASHCRRLRGRPQELAGNRVPRSLTTSFGRHASAILPPRGASWNRHRPAPRVAVPADIQRGDEVAEE